ncbi:MAG: pseudouridine synthase [Thermoleophilaceae bacterium]
MRLVKYLAHAGVASRRGAERLIAEGSVTVNGEPATDPARDVGDETVVAVDGRPVAVERRVVYLVNKPEGVVSTASDPQGRPIITDLVASERRLYPVGRLDIGTSGLILLTNDGELANLLTHPRYEVAKTYRVEVAPRPVPERALRRLRDGIELEDGVTLPAKVAQPSPGMLEIVLREGRKRQVRRMVEAAGHRVRRLERIAMGPLTLKGVPLGGHRRLSEAEVGRLRDTALRS